MKKEIFITILFFLIVINTPTYGFLGENTATSYRRELEMINELGKKTLERTEPIWREIEEQLRILDQERRNLVNLTPEEVNALSRNEIMERAQKSEAWEKNFKATQAKLYFAYAQLENDIKETNFEPDFIQKLLEYYEKSLLYKIRNLDTYFDTKVQHINHENIYVPYILIADMLFPDTKKYPELLPPKIDQATLDGHRNTIPEDFPGPLDTDLTEMISRDSKEAFFSFITKTHFNPIEDDYYYQIIGYTFAEEPQKRIQLEDKFILAYRTGANLDIPVTEIRKEVVYKMNNKLPYALTVASPEALIAIAKAYKEVVISFYRSYDSADYKFCMMFAENQNFVGVDYSKIVEMYFVKENNWQNNFFEALQLVFSSAQTFPAKYISPEQAVKKQYIEIRKKAYSSAKITNPKKVKNSLSPRRYCHIRYTMLHEITKLPRPLKEDTLRYMFAKDYENKRALK